MLEQEQLSHTERDDSYYRLLAGLAGTRLLEAAIELQLFELFAQRGPLTADEIASRLALHPKRTRKWLLVMRHLRLVEELPAKNGGQPRYQAGPFARAIFYEDGRVGWFYRDFLRFVRKAADYDFVHVLRGLPVPQVPYPPQSFEEAQHLESWMRDTAAEAIEAIERAFSFEGVHRLLDVGGGDGGMAIHYARKYPWMHITIFNLPNSAYMARQNVAAAGLGERIAVADGDFLREPLPQGYDLVQFSRVLADWQEDVCHMLLEKARRALLPGGRVLICEPLADDNPDLTIAWEFGYIPYDDFGVELYKPLRTYERLLSGTGFQLVNATRRNQDTVYAVLVAQRT